MIDSKTVAKKSIFTVLTYEKFLIIATGIYIALAITFLFVTNHYFRLMETPEYILSRISLSYIIIGVAAMIFPLLFVKNQKAKLAVIFGSVSLLLVAFALLLTLQPIKGMFYATYILPFALLVPYICLFVKRYFLKTKH